jgi:hypothetical protein
MYTDHLAAPFSLSAPAQNISTLIALLPDKFP